MRGEEKEENFKIQIKGREIVRTGSAGDSDNFEGQDVVLWRDWTGGHVKLFLWKLEKQHRVIVRSDGYRLLYQGCRHCLGRGLWDRMVQASSLLNVYSLRYTRFPAGRVHV